ncbi:MAG TPA: ATP-binding protein [Longimicrobiales bacterium]
MATDREARVETESAETAAASVTLVRALLVASCAVIVLFGAYELVVQTWLSDAGSDLLLLLHRVRSGIMAVIVAGVAGWLILKEGPRLLTAGPFPLDATAEGRVDPVQKRLHYARWFILMRWIAIIAATGVVVIAVDIAEMLPARVSPSLLGLLAVLTVLNLAYSVYLRLGEAGSVEFLVVQVYADLVVLIGLLHYSGGVENPLTPLLLLHVIIAGIVLGRRHAYRVAAVASLLFGLLAWAECTGAVPHYMLSLFPHLHVDGIITHAAHDPAYAASRAVLQALVLLLVAYFTTTLVDRIRADERQLEAHADRMLAQAQTLERALDTTGTALCLCDRDLGPFWANARWTAWVEHTPELSCSMRACGSPAISTLQDGVVREEEISSTTSDPPRVFHVTTAPVRDRSGQISQVVTLARDVTEQHAAQARALRAERLAAVGELAGQVAHEVNNPIAIISAKTRLLLADERTPLPPRAAQELGKIAELSDRVARIAQGLLSYCRPAPGARSPLDVVLPLRRALAYIETRAAEAGIVIRDELPQGMPWVVANAPELEQVFLNVLLNALDAMPDGGILQIRADTGSAASTPFVAVHVTDTGTGVPAALQARVFEPFLTTKGPHGSGLGLSICQGILRSHGGSIQLVSQEGRGTCVTVRLPSRAAPEPRDRITFTTHAGALRDA